MSSAKQPNVLFFFSDQHHPHRLGLQDGITMTPGLDRLARQGTMFSSCYCQCPLCVPSRSSLFSGKHVKSILTYENDAILDTSIHVPLPKVFSTAGYRTCVIGKQHINGEQYMGFMQRPYGDFNGQGHQPDPARGFDPRQGPSGLGEVRTGGYLALSGPTQIPEFQISDNIIAYEAVKFLQVHKASHPNEPFMLMLNFPKPHWPYNPPEQYFSMYDGKVFVEELRPDAWPDDVDYIRTLRSQWGIPAATKADMDRALAAYLGCISHIDHLVSEVIRSLEYLGYDEDTMIMYASDHGDMSGEHNLWQKGCFYEGSVGVPLIIRPPHRMAKAAQVVTEPVGLVDVYPTLLDICGLTIPEEVHAELEGVSLRSWLEGSVDHPHRDGVYSEIGWLGFAKGHGFMLRSGNYKYNWYEPGGHQLFNLSEDPAERVNLIDSASHRAIAAELRDRISSFLQPEKFQSRYDGQLRFAHQKYLNEFSNQYVLGDSSIVDARP